MAQERVFEPMSVSGILDATFSLYRDNFARWIAIVAVIQVPMLLLSTGLLLGIGHSVEANGEPDPGPLILGAVLIGLLSLVATCLCQGALTKNVSESYLGHSSTVGEAYAFVWPRLWTLIGASFLVGLVVALGLVLLVVPGIIFMLWFTLVTPCIVIEGVGAKAGMGRSRSLVKGNLGKVFALGLVVVLLGSAISGGIQLLTSQVVVGMSEDNPMTGVLLQQAFNAIGQILVAPISSAAFILLYYDLRIRKEGFDLEMLSQRLGGEATDDFAPLP